MKSIHNIIINYHYTHVFCYFIFFLLCFSVLYAQKIPIDSCIIKTYIVNKACLYEKTLCFNNDKEFYLDDVDIAKDTTLFNIKYSPEAEVCAYMFDDNPYTVKTDSLIRKFVLDSIDKSLLILFQKFINNHYLTSIWFRIDRYGNIHNLRIRLSNSIDTEHSRYLICSLLKAIPQRFSYSHIQQTKLKGIHRAVLILNDHIKTYLKN